MLKSEVIYLIFGLLRMSLDHTAGALLGMSNTGLDLTEHVTLRGA